eukprot:TRINITY_DN3049_c0_g1_i1.p1 TRINITY_DN3049_c0_g1~~TRINITY_DN3049_c0_g1_i1.p1  ORF type:complete len:380 (+),score=35.34 TRINITY_DN3049_c0_g1_i1:77-1216(+)
MKPHLLFLALTLALVSLSRSEDDLALPDEWDRFSYNWRSTTGVWGRRSILAGQYSLGPFNQGAWFRSVDRTVTNSTYDSDIIWGLVYCHTGSPPTSWLGYFSASANVTRVPHGGNWDWTTFDVDIAAGFIASSYLSLIEKNAEGSIVTTTQLSLLTFEYDAATSSSLTNSTLGIYAFVINGAHLWKNVRIQLRYIVTEEGGQLDILGGLPIVPKSLESLILIDDYPYEHPNNTLTLVTAAATGEGVWESNTQFVSGSGAEKVFFHVASKALVDGALVDVVVGGHSVGKVETSFSMILWNQIRRKYANAQAQIVSVQFPAGAKGIVYDPTIGSGESPYDDVPGSNVLAIVLGVVGGLVLVSLVIALVVYKNRAEYESVSG